ncbi:hypothetical protein FMGBMHLM_2817 [Methylobacterium aerolatum]|nr:hypothetical protein FMGBMHLM_2817 [Methylobacterium aerolatum]
MWNFALGAIAGGMTAAVLTVAAVRHPEIQTRIGLSAPPAPISVALAQPVEPRCVPPKALPKSAGNAEAILFNRQRFWSVSP